MEVAFNVYERENLKLEDFINEHASLGHPLKSDFEVQTLITALV